MKRLFCALLAAGLTACGAAGPPPRAAPGRPGCVTEFSAEKNYFPHQVKAEYAKGWQVRYERSYKVLKTTVQAAGGHAKAGSREIDSTYVLLQCGAPRPELTGELAGATVIEVPVRTMADGGSVLYASLEKLGKADALVGYAEPFIGDVEAPYLPKIAERIKAGKVAEIGYEVNYEALADADPDFYTNYAGDDQTFSKIEELGIPIVFYFPYSETPLGAAEQIKFLSLFFNAEQRAQQVFDPIEERYLKLRAQIDAHVAGQKKPKVLIGTVGESGSVTTRQRERFEPQLIREAGAEPVPDLPGGGIATLSLEKFLDAGADTDYWMDLVFFPKHKTGADYIAGDDRLARLPALENGRTFHRVGARGADYFLNGALEADLILRDMVNLLHPELLKSGDELQFVKHVPAE
ncbi:ABC transporter substrate-binding protein [Nonomuraea sp. PA05]|uniref:ABC transporter substrate-binding protein n=1 Tax=Nonomuraea sp. PA05 TaxID=2604466 RepID=UPI00165285B2|nr:ABC transporter substrate-binding protein [Nonomuraea sp. PA05]